LTVVRTRADGDQIVRAYDPATRTLQLSAAIEPGQRAFQLATQIARLEAEDVIDGFASVEHLSRARRRGPLARIGFANYFAGALVLPYRRFLAASEALRYDIDLPAQRFGVSFETVCHRLSTLQRPDACGIPFFFMGTPEHYSSELAGTAMVAIAPPSAHNLGIDPPAGSHDVPGRQPKSTTLNSSHKAKASFNGRGSLVVVEAAIPSGMESVHGSLHV
jgi:hypothetical protein